MLEFGISGQGNCVGEDHLSRHEQALHRTVVVYIVLFQVKLCPDCILLIHREKHLKTCFSPANGQSMLRSEAGALVFSSQVL